MVIFETGLLLVFLGVVVLFLFPLILKAWEAYCGWVFKNRG
jgi:Na+-transporting methylmalonyl-CoA/oxaloacetate decarboxylase gamma subunit